MHILIKKASESPMKNEYYPFINLPLPYDYDALEPYIDTKTMYLHHNRHLQTYIDNLNKTLESYPPLQTNSLRNLLKNLSLLPENIRQSIRNNGGGVFNHRFYFDLLAPPATAYSKDQLSAAIMRTYGNKHQFNRSFKDAALSVFGSGYAWLVLDKSNLKIMTTSNQNTPLEYGLEPILTIDVWEHAYYLKHYNQRSQYIDNWFQVLNWQQAEENFFSAILSQNLH